MAYYPSYIFRKHKCYLKSFEYSGRNSNRHVHLAVLPCSELQTSCSPGQHLNSDYKTCTQCIANTYNSGGKTRTCTECPAGSESSTGALSCTPCPAGKYGSAAGTGCRTCPANYYNSGSGATSCTRCPSGKISPAGSTSSSSCFYGNLQNVFIKLDLESIIVCIYASF